MLPDEYLKMAEVEDAMWYYRALHRHVGRNLARFLPEAAPCQVLDAGCGTGGLLRRLRESHPTWQLTGLDVSPIACALARSRSGADVVEGSVMELPFPDAAFDAVVSCDVLCQVPDAGRAMREIRRCLKPGGVVVLTMPAYPWMYAYHDRQVGNLRRYTRGKVIALLREGPLDHLRSTYWNTLPFPLAVLRRKVFPPRKPTSDMRLYPAVVEAGFNGLMALEHGWQAAGLRLPFGSSVLTVGQKPAPPIGAHPE
jgi:SAM-dependent methyltransferase